MCLALECRVCFFQEGYLSSPISLLIHDLKLIYSQAKKVDTVLLILRQSKKLLLGVEDGALVFYLYCIVEFSQIGLKC